MDARKTHTFVNQLWDKSIVPELCEYIKVPNKSPMFDHDWENHGYMDEAAEMLAKWCKKQPIKGIQTEVIRLKGRTPLLFIEIPGDSEELILLYGHYDKQPEFSGWNEDLGPWTPVIKENKLYGRGGADDGYAVFSSLTAIRALQEQGIPHARCAVLIEGCEESGSFDLPYYIDHLEHRLGEPSLVVCLDAECGNYDQLWCTTSLRGNLTGNLTVEILSEGVHSGTASGVVPSCFRVLRQLLSRVEDETSGQILIDELITEIPRERQEQAKLAAEVLGNSVYRKFPWIHPEIQPLESNYELLIKNNWGPALTVTGADGMPAVVNAGNTMLPKTTLKLSFRLPPTTDADNAAIAVKTVLEENPPPCTKVSFKIESAMTGWDAPPIAEWLEKSMNQASKEYFDKPSVYMGTGGTIPFMGMLGEKFPNAQFLITGLLGPQSNAHGPNEFLHITKGKKLTCCVAQILEDHFHQA